MFNWHTQRPQHKIAFVYFTIASLWILCSDLILYSLGVDNTLIPGFNILKGIVFVMVTTGILYLHLRREFDRRFQLEAQLEEQIQHVKQSREALVQSEQRFRKAVEEAPLPILIFTEDGEILSFSQAWLEITGYTADQLKTLDSWTELAYGEDKQIVRAVIDKLFDLDQQVHEGEFKVNCADGTRRIWEFSSTPLGHLPDKRRIAISIATDLTDRKKLEDKLNQANQFLETLIRNSPLGIITFDPEGLVSLWNPAMEELLGWSKDEVIGKRLPHIREQDQAEFDQLRQRVAQGQTLKGIDVQRQRKDGQTIDLSISAGPLYDSNAVFVGAVGILKDISDRKQIENALRESEERLRLFIEHAPASLAMFDHTMRYLVVSRRWVADYNLEGRDIIGQSHYEVFPEIPDQWKIAHQAGLAGKVLKAVEDKFERIDGSTQWLHWEIHPWYANEDKTIGGIIIFTEDITERKRMEDALRESEQRFRLLIQEAPDGIFVQAHHRFAYINPAACRLFNAEHAEILLGTPVMERFHPDYHAQILKRIQTLNTEHQIVPQAEEIFLRMDGSSFTVEVSAVPITFEGQDGALVFFRDITERKAVEDALRKSETRFRTLVNSMEDIVFTLDHEGRHTGVYGRWLKKYGFTSDMFMGKTSAEILGDESGQVHEVANAQALAGQSVNYEWTNGGQTIQTSLSPLHDDDGQVKGIVGIGRDITPLKQTEQQLREAEDFAHSTVDALSAHIAIINEQGVILAVNNAWNQFASQNGVNPDVVGIGVNYLATLDAVDPDCDDAPTAQAVLSGIQQIIRGELSEFSLEYPCHSPDVQRWFMIRATPFADEESTRIVVAHENITEKVLAERLLAADNTRLEQLVSERTVQLRRLNTRMNIILNNVSNPILLVDVNGDIDMTNPAFNRRLGYQPDELFGQALWSIVDPASQPALMRRWNALHGDTIHDEATATPIEVQLITKHGTSFDAEVSLSEIPHNENQVVCTLYDISHLKEVERIKDAFISMVSHELRTPIAVIMLTASNIQQYYDRLTDDRKQQKLAQISEQVKKLSELVTSVLDISRFSSRQGKRGDDLVDVGQALQNVVIEFTEQVETKQQHLSVEIIADNITVRGEYFDLIRIWRNLLSNSIKYTDEGGSIDIRLWKTDIHDQKQLPDLTNFTDNLPDDLYSGNYVIGLIEDNGHGIRPEDLPHLFTRFYRGWAVSTNITGTGLGLSFVRDLVQLYGGDIAVKSELGSGTTFCFWLPVDDNGIDDMEYLS